MATKALDAGKEKLEKVLRKKAYKDVEEYLASKDIDINSVDDEDIEVLVDAKVSDMQSTLKGIAIGGAFAAVVSTLF